MKLEMSLAIGIFAVSLISLMCTYALYPLILMATAKRRPSHSVESLAVAFQGSFYVLPWWDGSSLSMRRRALFHVPYYFCAVNYDHLCEQSLALRKHQAIAGLREGP